jgi:prolyl-tRNA synthetase
MTADKLYAELQADNLEVLYDDRGEKAGFMFSDADLLGIPFRLIISPKTLAEGKVELKRRGEKDAELVEIAEVAAKMKQLVADEFEKYNV